MFMKVCVAIAFHYIGLLPGAVVLWLIFFPLYAEAHSTLETFDLNVNKEIPGSKNTSCFDDKKQANK